MDAGHHTIDSKIGEAADRVNVDCSRRDGELERCTALVFLFDFPHTLDQLARLFEGVRDPVPTTAEACGPLEGRLRVTAKDIGRMGLLSGLRFELEPFALYRFSLEPWIGTTPQFGHQLQILIVAQRAIIPVHPDPFEFFLEPPDANAEEKAPV